MATQCSTLLYYRQAHAYHKVPPVASLERRSDIYRRTLGGFRVVKTRSETALSFRSRLKSARCDGALGAISYIVLNPALDMYQGSARVQQLEGVWRGA